MRTDAIAIEHGKAGAGSAMARRLQRLLCDSDLRYVTPFICLLWLFADMASGWWTWTPTFATMQRVDQKHVYGAAMGGRVVASFSFVIATLIIDACAGAYFSPHSSQAGAADAVGKRCGALLIDIICTSLCRVLPLFWRRVASHVCGDAGGFPTDVRGGGLRTCKRLG